MSSANKPRRHLEVMRDVYREEHPWQYPEPEPPRNGCAMAFCIVVLIYFILGIIVSNIMAHC